jgi:chromosome partitioning protein
MMGLLAMNADVIDVETPAAKSRKKKATPAPASKQATEPKVKRSKVLVVATAKGGSGKTTLSLNISVCAVTAGIKTIAVDADEQRTLTHSLERRPPEAPEIKLITISLDRIGEAFLQLEAEDVELVIIDTPPNLEKYKDEIRELLARADFVLVPTRSGIPDLDSVTEWMGIVRDQGVQGAFVLNATKRSAKRTARARTRLLKHGELCPIDVRNLEDIERCHEAGVGLIEISRAVGSEDIETVWEYLRRELSI